MERGYAARHANVDAFLASLGVDPGELAGLELPATVDVMRERFEFLHSLERVEFLHSLGLSARRDDGGDISPAGRGSSPRRSSAGRAPLLPPPPTTPPPPPTTPSPAVPAPASAPLGLVGSSGVVLHRRCPPHEGLGG
uniref:Uncharacterized protein n=1 Tax=Oryza barthii TaxID=65489 RepID=A0A0D3H7C3_9ORYZ